MVMALDIKSERSNAYCHIVEPKSDCTSVLSLQMRVRQLAMAKEDDLGCWTEANEGSTRPSITTTWEL